MLASNLHVQCKRRLQVRIDRGEAVHSVMVHKMGAEADAADAADARMDVDIIARRGDSATQTHMPSVVIISALALVAVCASWIQMLRDQSREFSQQQEEQEMLWTAQGVQMDTTSWAQPPMH